MLHSEYPTAILYHSGGLAVLFLGIPNTSNTEKPWKSPMQSNLPQRGLNVDIFKVMEPHTAHCSATAPTADPTFVGISYSMQ